MFDKRELLAMLTAHGIDPLKPIGGAPNLTQMDVAGMMSRLDPFESELLRVKYAGDAINGLSKLWLDRALAHFKINSEHKIETLCTLTLQEFVDEPRCKTCGGTGERIVNSQWEICPACDGLKYRLMSDRALARELQLKRLQAPWVERRNWCRFTLQNAEIEAVKKFY